MNNLIGEYIKKNRIAKNLSFEKISKDTKIGIKYLKAIEEEDFDVFPGEVYAFGFLRNYARYLELNEEEILKAFERKYTKEKEEELKEIEKGRQKVKNRYNKKYLYIVLGVLILFSVKILDLTFQASSIELKAPRILKAHYSFKDIYVRAKIIAPVWLRITSDGKVVFRGIVNERNKTFKAKRQLKIRIGNFHRIKLFLGDRQINILPPKQNSIRELVLSKSQGTIDIIQNNIRLKSEIKNEPSK